MKTTVTKYDFERAFADAGRKDQFSYEALDLLFEHIEQMESDNGQEIDLDVVAICCDYSEDTVSDIIANYSIDVEGMDDDEQVDAVRGYLNDNTTLVGETSSGFVYTNF